MIKLLFTFSLLFGFIFSSCIKEKAKTDYKVEVTSASEPIDYIVLNKAYDGNGGSTNYAPNSTEWTQEFEAQRKDVTIEVDANCFDSNFEPQSITIKIYRKGKLVKEVVGSGNVEAKYED